MQHVFLYILVFVLGVAAGFIVRSYLGEPDDDGDEWDDEERTKTLYRRDTDKH